MDAKEDSPAHSHRPGGGNPQLVIITQLLHVISNMQHIDELLLWLSHVIGQRLNIQVVQFWANQAHTNGHYSTELRAVASQNALLPLHIVNNAQIAEIVGDLLSEQHGAKSQPVASIFRLPQSDLLGRCNLHYWESTFVSNSGLLPPMSNHVSSGAIATPLAMIASLFTYQPSHENVQATVTRILDYALSIARNRGLLLSAASTPLSSSASLASNRAQPQQLTLNDLIVHRVEKIEAMQASNPLANAAVISDKQARRLYSFIDGKRSIAELVDITHLGQQNFIFALKWLIQQKRVRLHEPYGQAVDSSLFLEPL